MAFLGVVLIVVAAVVGWQNKTQIVGFLQKVGIVSTLPSANHGMLSAMEPVARIDDLVKYMDYMYEYMETQWPDQIVKNDVFGHHTEHKLKLAEYQIAGGTWSVGHGCSLELTIDYDKTTQKPTRQNLSMSLCLGNDGATASTVHDFIDEYFGLNVSLADISKAVDSLVLGKQALVKTDDLVIQFYRCEIESLDDMHVRVLVDFTDVEQTGDASSKGVLVYG